MESPPYRGVKRAVTNCWRAGDHSSLLRPSQAHYSLLCDALDRASSDAERLGTFILRDPWRRDTPGVGGRGKRFPEPRHFPGQCVGLVARPLYDACVRIKSRASRPIADVHAILLARSFAHYVQIAKQASTTMVTASAIANQM